MLQGSVLAVGALHVLPPRAAKAYAAVRAACADGLCEVVCERCVSAEPLPRDAAELRPLAPCECGARRVLRWRCDEAPPAAAGGDGLVDGAPLAAGAAAALGPAFVEGYGVWYRLGARAAIGNGAYDAGRGATARTTAAEAEAEAEERRRRAEPRVSARLAARKRARGSGVVGDAAPE